MLVLRGGIKKEKPSMVSGERGGLPGGKKKQEDGSTRWLKGTLPLRCNFFFFFFFFFPFLFVWSIWPFSILVPLLHRVTTWHHGIRRNTVESFVSRAALFPLSAGPLGGKKKKKKKQEPLPQRREVEESLK